MSMQLCTRIFMALLAVVALPAAAADFDLLAGGGGVTWRLNGQHGISTLTVHGDNAFVHRAAFPAGTSPFFQAPADGSYRWQLQAAPVGKASRPEGGAEPRPLPGGLFAEGLIVVSGGVAQAVMGDDGTRRDDPLREVIPEDLIVLGSVCVGFDCVDPENFGFDTIRLKENSTRIKFQDTSVGSFPSTDWQLTANDAASGGANKFSIEDITAGRVPFTVLGGAPTNAMFVDAQGRLGLKTATPVLELHLNDSDTPAIRLEQNNTGGFTAQTWDIGGNEANFFIRDVTSGSRLPFRIQPGALTNSLVISSDSFVGVGTLDPTKKLHVLLANNTNDTVALFENNNAARFDLRINSNVNGGVDTTWFFQADSDANRTLKISKFGGGGTVVTINNRLDANGVTFKVDGSIQATNVIFPSSRKFKTDFAAVSSQEVLEKVAGLEIGNWRFHHEPTGTRHLGPFAEDFATAFGLGQDGQHIGVTDINGVALKAIQGLYEELQAVRGQLKTVNEDNAQLRALVEGLRQP